MTLKVVWLDGDERKTMTHLKGKNVLVLGASGVLGGKLTELLAANGATVMATSSTIESAERVPHPANPRLLLDLANPESIDVLIEYLKDSKVQIDGIINATGVVAFGNFSETDVETINRLFHINVLGPIKLFRGLIEELKQSAAAGREPFLVNISGIVAESPMAGLAIYSASKSAMFALNQALSRELRRDGIRVIDARPGHTETGLASRAISGVAPNFPQGMTPEQVATRIVQAIVEDEKDLPSSAF